MEAARQGWLPPVWLLRSTSIALCALILGAAGIALAQLVALLSLVLAPIAIAALLTRALIVPTDALARLGWPAGVRAAAVLIGFLLALAVVLAFVAPRFVDELDGLGSTIEDGVDQVQGWVVRNAPGDVTQRDLEQLREDATAGLTSEAGGGRAIAQGAMVAVEIAAGAVLALLLTFFALKDGRKAQSWAVSLVPEPRRAQARAMAAASWAALGAYLRGAALLGGVEAVIIGAALALVGSELVLPVMVITFLAAFVPLVGAVVAGAAAVLVTLATAGTTEAIVVLIVAVLVQQLDNDLLAPVIYGRALQLHPVAILLSITAGTALFGFAGTVLAVPVTAVTTAAYVARRPAEPDEAAGT